MGKRNVQVRTVEIVEYDWSWPVLFEKEAKTLRHTLKGVAASIHHIGSTAVEGLAAKPIIDILIEVNSLAALDALNEEMQRLGYVPKGEYGIAGRRFYPKGGESRTHHIHAFGIGDPNLVRHLAFRDYLREHPKIAQEYSSLKKAVAKACANDVDRYCEGKDVYVKHLEALAVREKRNSFGFEVRQ